MTQLVGSNHYVIYRGRQYIELGSGKGFVVIDRTPGSDDCEYPDALRFGPKGYEERVVLPTSALSARWHETVRGEWRGANVWVSSFQRNGKVQVYTASPIDGQRLGMDGNQHDGWLGWAPIDEVNVTSREVDELPHGVSEGEQTGAS